MQDRSVVLLVVGFLGIIALISIGSLVALLLNDKNVPDAALVLFSNLATGSLAGMTGLLANTHTSPPNLPTAEVPVVPVTSKDD